MTPTTTIGTPSRPARLGGQVWNVIVAAWGVVTGIAPHVLHHVGPLAGTALVAGAGGRLVFAVVGLIATIPLLRRLYRRFGTWMAPAFALMVFGVVFAFSAFVVGPGISDTATESPRVETDDHDGHDHDTNTQGGGVQ